MASSNQQTKKAVKKEPGNVASGSSMDDDVVVVTLESLGEMLKSVAESNKNKLEIIEKRKEKQVVCGFAYGMNVTLPSTGWKLEATAGKTLVSERLSEWSYTGTPLQVADDVFNDKVDYSFYRYTDVVRLNETLPQVGSKYYNLLADKPETRKAVMIFINNLEIISTAIDDIMKLTEDAKNDLSTSEEVKTSMQALSEAATSLQARLGSQVSIHVKYTNDTRCNSAKRAHDTMASSSGSIVSSSRGKSSKIRKTSMYG